jgi:hypothetical protein
LKTKGIDVTGQYVSTIKSNMKAEKKIRKGLRRVGRKSKLRGSHTDNGLTVMNAAIELVRVAGGVDAARNVLESVEKLGKALQ